jgi:hypothetical protein
MSLRQIFELCGQDVYYALIVNLCILEEVNMVSQLGI